MELALGAIDSVVSRLEKLLQEESYSLQSDTRMDLRIIAKEQQTWIRMRAISQDPAFRVEFLEQSDKKFVSLCAREMRDLSYDLDDVLDSFFLVHAEDEHVHTNLRRVKRLGAKTINLCGMMKKKAQSLHQHIADGRSHQLTDAIREITGRIFEVFERLAIATAARYELPLRNLKTGTVDPRLPALYRNERELVGIEEARDEVITMLTQGGVKVVSIIGIGGVGKTTLAKAVYNRLQAQFDCTAFVSVSPNPDSKKVCEDILLDLAGKDYMSIVTQPMDLEKYFNEIGKLLHDKRCLIVLDDVWHTQLWRMIEFPDLFHNSHHESRIITTTRISHVAHHFWRGATYILRPLSRMDSEKLFYTRIFGGEGSPPDSRLAEISDRIMKKCGGLPLAIITVASVLASKPWEEWSEVYNSVTLRREPNRYIDNMTEVLSLSYHHLPSHLKMCLLYLSVFPEDCWIEKDFLIWRWIAEGFVVMDRDATRRCFFEAGEKYFYDLVDTSMIQVEDDYYKGPVYGCRIHPTVFSLLRSLSSEENVSIVFNDEHYTSPDSNNNARIIALHSNRNVEHNIVSGANISMEKVRSFNASLCSIDRIPQVSSFQVLRVLALEYCPGMNRHHHLVQIGNLVHLRYLGLVGAGVLELPEEALGGLRFLQTLDLRETVIDRLPRTISKLQRLMCLCVGRTRTVSEVMVERLSSLEDLRLHHVDGDSLFVSVKLLRELSRLQRLRVLVLGFEEMDTWLAKAFVEFLFKCVDIQRLEVYCKSVTADDGVWEEGSWDWQHLLDLSHLEQLVLGGDIWFSGVPPWIKNLCLISHLHLGVKVLEDDHLQILGRMPSLRSIMLMTAASEEQEQRVTTIAASDGAFPGLCFFSINIPVRFESGLPKLEHVELRVRVAQISDSWLCSLANLPSLQKVTVVLDCRGASAVETKEAEETLQGVIGVHSSRRLKLEVTKENGNQEVPLVRQFAFKKRFEDLQSEMDEMQANPQVQVQPANDSDEEIAPAKAASE